MYLVIVYALVVLVPCYQGIDLQLLAQRTQLLRREARAANHDASLLGTLYLLQQGYHGAGGETRRDLHGDIAQVDEGEYRDEVVQIGGGANSDYYLLMMILYGRYVMDFVCLVSVFMNPVSSLGLERGVE